MTPPALEFIHELCVQKRVNNLPVIGSFIGSVYSSVTSSELSFVLNGIGCLRNISILSLAPILADVTIQLENAGKDSHMPEFLLVKLV